MGPDPGLIFTEFTAWLTRLSGLPGCSIAPETALADIPGLDSLRLLQTIAHLEERFGVEADVDRFEHLWTAADMVWLIATSPSIASPS